jgi:segregation and condensation protein B
MSVKAKVEAIIYATEEPVTLNQLASLLKDTVLAELRAEEEARLALNETVSQPSLSEDEDEDNVDELPEDTLEIANESREAKGIADVSHPVVTDPTAPPVLPGEPLTESNLPQEQLRETNAGAEEKKAREKQELGDVKSRLNSIIDELILEYASEDRGMEIRHIAGGYRMATKPEHHDVVVNFAKSLKPAMRLSLQALETLAVIAYKQPVTLPEISEIRGVDSAGVISTLLDRKLVTTSGRKQVIGRPILYKTTKEFLLRFGLNDISELPSVEEFEKLGDPQTELFTASEASQPSQPTAEDGGEEDVPVTEGSPELVGPANSTQPSASELAEGGNDLPVTEAVPQLASSENRTTEPHDTQEEKHTKKGDQS